MRRLPGGGRATTLRAASAALLILFAATPAVAQDSAAVSMERSCAATGFCEQMTRQVQRHFHAPPESAGARGEVCFRIQRDGSVTDIRAQRVSGGGAAFRLAMMEAVEAAGSRRAFGPLPEPFDPQRLRWCVELSSQVDPKNE
jgi:hypothetical protein